MYKEIEPDNCASRIPILVDIAATIEALNGTAHFILSKIRSAGDVLLGADPQEGLNEAKEIRAGLLAHIQRELSFLSTTLNQIIGQQDRFDNVIPTNTAPPLGITKQVTAGCSAKGIRVK